MPEKFQQVLPQNWDGKFSFTNDSDEDFVFEWDKKAYLFPAQKTVDMMRMNFNATPVEVQSIRKKAAKKWAEREFFKSQKLKGMESFEKNPQTGAPTMSSFHSARSYSEVELKDDILRCLTPLPEGEPLVAPAKVRNTLEELHKDDDGSFITKPTKGVNEGTLEDPSTFAKPTSNEILVN